MEVFLTTISEILSAAMTKCATSLLETSNAIQSNREKAYSGGSSAQAAVVIDVAQQIHTIVGDTLVRLRELSTKDPELKEVRLAIASVLQQHGIRVRAIEATEAGRLQRRLCDLRQETEQLKSQFPDGAPASVREALDSKGLELKKAFEAFQSPERDSIEQSRAIQRDCIEQSRAIHALTRDPAVVGFLHEVFNRLSLG